MMCGGVSERASEVVRGREWRRREGGEVGEKDAAVSVVKQTDSDALLTLEAKEV